LQRTSDGNAAGSPLNSVLGRQRGKGMNGAAATACVALALFSIGASASSPEPRSRLMRARSLKCEFGAGSHAEWKDGVLVVGSGRFAPAGEKATIHYDSIDHQKRRARVIATWAEGLEVLASQTGVTFVEHIASGGLAITTVFAAYDQNNAFPAVISKHVDAVGPFPQQYYGSCTALQ
jgi:hypothetical protein